MEAYQGQIMEVDTIMEVVTIMEVGTIMEVDTILEVEVAKIRYLYPEINKQICALLKNGIYLIKSNKPLQTLQV